MGLAPVLFMLFGSRQGRRALEPPGDVTLREM
jgi:hypothetical protein